MLPSTTLKPKTCAHCKTQFMPARPMQKVCSPTCARRKVEADKKAEKAKTKARREAIEPFRKLVSDAQAAFNEFIRLRDADKPCVSCGVTDPPMTAGGQWDAGHFLSRGSHPELRFDEDNCHKQCKACNGGGGRFKHHERTVSAAFREELMRRIGTERLERLEGPHEIVKWTRDALRQIKVIYRAKLRELKKERA